MLTLIPSLAPGVPGEGARLGGIIAGSRFVPLPGVSTVGIIPPTKADLEIRSPMDDSRPCDGGRFGDFDGGGGGAEKSE